MSVDCSPEAAALAESMAGDPPVSWKFAPPALANWGSEKMPFASCPVAAVSAA